jgi:hypothetical protein
MVRRPLERRGVAPHPYGLLGGRCRTALLVSSISRAKVLRRGSTIFASTHDHKFVILGVRFLGWTLALRHWKGMAVVL